MTPLELKQRIRAVDWRKWRRQLSAVIRADLRRNLFSRQAFLLYLLAFAPAGIILLHALDSPHGRHCNIDLDTRILAGIVTLFYVRLGIFFGTLSLFTWLFRGEVVQRSLHYYFLVPMRREVLAVGKFVSGAITAIVVFGAGVITSFSLMYTHFGAAGQRYVFEGPGLSQLGAYLTISTLACIGYGAVFMGLSLIFRNPIIPAAIVFFWETISAVLPALLQKLSITFYLKNLSPIDLPPEGLMALFTVVAQPVPKMVAILALLLLSSVVLALAAVKIRTMEISYSKE